MTPVSPEYRADEVDLRQLAHVLWRYRVSIVAIALLGAALGVVASLYQTRYRWEGLFLTPGLTVDNYKSFEAALANKPRMQEFLRISGETESEAGRSMLDMVDRTGEFQKAIRPDFTFTEQDAKAFGVKPDATAVVGMRLALEASRPSERAPIRLLSEYVRDTKIKADLEALLRGQCHQHTTFAQQLRNDQIADEYAISQLEKRADILRDAIKRHPQAAQIENRQIVLLEQGGERYLSLDAQLVALEIAIADKRLVENDRARSRIATGLRKAYYCGALETVRKPVLGRDFLRQLEDIQASVFADQDAANDAAEATGNEFSMQRAGWIDAYLEGMRFVASPEGAEMRVRKPGLVLGLVLGAMLGGLFGVLLALLRGWWRDNAAQIVADD